LTCYKKKIPIDLIFHFVKENIGMEKEKGTTSMSTFRRLKNKSTEQSLPKKKKVSMKKNKNYTGFCQVTRVLG
jgi:hypothetical protein